MDLITKKQLNVLIQLAHADKHFAVEERDMIFKISRDRAFPEEIVNALIRQPEPIGSLAIMSDSQKIHHLLDCVDLIFVDQRVFESEVIFARGIAMRLGFKKEAVDYLIENRKLLTPDQLITQVVSKFSSN
jgi:hypothetical protein